MLALHARQGILPRTSPEGHDEQMSQCQARWVAELFKAERHVRLGLLALSPIGPKQSIPEGKVEAKIAVGLHAMNGMVDAMHIRGHDHRTNEPVQSSWYSHVAV